MSESGGYFFLALALVFAFWGGYDAGRGESTPAPSFDIDWHVPGWLLFFAAMIGGMVGIVWFQPFRQEGGAP